ncbi:WecE Predicted pyridoxal phosphate-dependent enzyme apparently involved in regulation of cell wall biogenesis [actinobacterium SCGC AAA044-D11]
MEEIFMSGPSITEEDIEIVLDSLRNGWYGAGAYAYVEKFEREFASWHNRQYALMTPNCTHSIHLLLAALNIGNGDEVIVPDITWIASAAPITYLGALPVFADVDEDTWCLSAETIREKITDRTKAVIAVDLYGNMPNMDELRELCDKHGIYLIEDAAEAIGSTYLGRKAGTFGIGSVFSFHRTKTLTTGEGGMLLVDDQVLYERCKFLRDHGRSPGGYFNTEVTFKYMPSNLAASLGYAQFLRIDELVGKKIWIWEQYKERLEQEKYIKLNPTTAGNKNSYWSTVMLLDPESGHNRDSIMEKFGKLNLPVRPFFYPLTQLPAFKEFLTTSSQPNRIAQKLSTSGVCLPSALNLREEQIELVCNSINRILRNG